MLRRARRVGLSGCDLKPLAGGRRLIRYDLRRADEGVVARADRLGVPYALFVSGRKQLRSVLGAVAGSRLFRGLELQSLTVTRSLVRELAGLPNLSYLRFGPDLSGRPGLFAELAHLRTVALDSVWNTAPDLSLLDQFGPQDVHIHVYGAAPDAVRWPLNLGNVTALSITGVRATFEMSALVRRMPRLTRLVASSGELDDGAAETLRGRPVTELVMSGGRLTDAGLRAIASLVKLERLDLSDGRACGGATPELAGLKRLRVLELSQFDLSGGRARFLASMPRLGRVRLRFCSFADADFAHLAGAGRLRGLDIHSPDVDGSGLALLGPLKSLRGLSIQGGGFDDAGMAALPNFPNLRHLDLCRTRATDAGAVHFAALPRLKSLWVMYTPIGDGIRHLARPDRIKFLSASGSHVTGLLRAAIDLDLAGVAFGRWEHARGRPARPTNADVRCVKLPTDCVTLEMLQEVRRLPNCEAIFIESHQLTNESVRALVRTGDVCRMPQFAGEVVSLAHAFLDGDGVMMLVPYLGNARRLELFERYVSAEDAARVAEALPGCDVVRN